MTPYNFSNWPASLRSVFLKGAHARLTGEPIEACPYVDRRTASGRLTWSRSFISAWEDGWRHADRDREDALITLKYAGASGRRRVNRLTPKGPARS